jgi:hypothetical protein
VWGGEGMQHARLLVDALLQTFADKTMLQRPAPKTIAMACAAASRPRQHPLGGRRWQPPPTGRPQRRARCARRVRRGVNARRPMHAVAPGSAGAASPRVGLLDYGVGQPVQSFVQPLPLGGDCPLHVPPPPPQLWQSQPLAHLCGGECRTLVLRHAGESGRGRPSARVREGWWREGVRMMGAVRLRQRRQRAAAQPPVARSMPRMHAPVKCCRGPAMCVFQDWGPPARCGTPSPHAHPHQRPQPCSPLPCARRCRAPACWQTPGWRCAA